MFTSKQSGFRDNNRKIMCPKCKAELYESDSLLLENGAILACSLCLHEHYEELYSKWTKLQSMTSVKDYLER